MINDHHLFTSRIHERSIPVLGVRRYSVGDVVSEKESTSSQMVCEIIWRSKPLVWAEGCCILLTGQDARVAERGDEAAGTR